jgi:glutathione S-transferase
VPLRVDGHPCWRVEKALIDANIPYDVVYEPALPRSRRARVIAATGQPLLPAIEFPDGRWLWESSETLADRIRAGQLFDAPHAA